MRYINPRFTYLLCYLPTNRLLTLFSLRYFPLGDALSK